MLLATRLTGVYPQTSLLLTTRLIGLHPQTSLLLATPLIGLHPQTSLLLATRLRGSWIRSTRFCIYRHLAETRIAHTHTHTDTHTHTRTQAHTHARTHTHTHTHTHARTHADTYARTHARTHTRAHTHTHTNTHTHTQTHTHTCISAHKAHTSCQFTAQKASPTFQHRLRCFPPLVISVGGQEGGFEGGGGILGRRPRVYTCMSGFIFTPPGWWLLFFGITLGEGGEYMYVRN